MKIKAPHDWKKNTIYVAEDADYIYVIAITTNHPLFKKVYDLCYIYQNLMRKPNPRKNKKLWIE